MKGFLILVLPGLVSLLGIADSSARAEMIHFSWVPDPMMLRADGPRSSAVMFTHEQASLNVINTGGTWTGIATELRTVSSASANHPDTFVNRPYSLTLTITDNHHQSLLPPIIFTGVLNGTLSRDSANLSNTFTNSQTQTFFNRTLIVTIGPYIAPGPPGHHRTGSIGAQVVVIGEGPPPPPVNKVPEPSTLALSSLGGILLGWKAWRRWRHDVSKDKRRATVI